MLCTQAGTTQPYVCVPACWSPHDVMNSRRSRMISALKLREAPTVPDYNVDVKPMHAL